MSEAAKPLPSFDNPPIVEVALSVQFDSLAQLRTPQIGALWLDFRDRFPVVEENAPLDPVFERFGVAPTTGATARFQMLSRPPTPRCWFLNRDGTELIQVQQDRFVHNWRKISGQEPYPRYLHVRSMFSQELQRFQDFIRRETIGEFVPNQCEVSYVNHVVIGDESKNFDNLDIALTLFSTEQTEKFLPSPEDARLAVRYVITNHVGEPIGRLHVSAEPVYRKGDDMPMILLTLTARGRPLSEDVDGVLAFFDVGHEWIVRGFTSITTSKMHALWRRQP